ncbi:zinc dependent phospholipase C family protein [Abyssisolibacter fermentans]|uniref:zinc dependent phospholipase C family protein n=1 Tax=Abyssisolibacter fermentans TaxID=1766203 RepID=UPI00083097EB|nr:zinc dependent phospholipase C family protein [Abyssisolibacter fermentans]
MATWITHLRVAEKLLKEFDFNKKEFLIGNIAPDSGVPNEDYTEFDPPTAITHFRNGGQIKAEEFYEKYVCRTNISKKELDFCIGYYVHLLTDKLWSKLHNQKKKQIIEYEEQLNNDPKFIWKVKEDWYGLDFIYLKEHDGNVFDEFMKLSLEKEYLDYFPKGAINKKVKYIQDYYSMNDEADIYTGKYLKKEEMNRFVDDTSVEIRNTLNKNL